MLLPNEWFSDPISKKTYAKICAKHGVSRLCLSLVTGRCGSTFLSEVVHKCGFGWGYEDFNEIPAEQYFPFSKDRFDLYLGGIFARQVVSGIVYIQTTCDRYNCIARLLPFDFVRPEDVSLIFRRDVFSQAISYINATKTNIWHSNQVVSDLQNNEVTLVDEDARTREWVQGILRMEVECRRLFPHAPAFYYEDIVSAPVATLLAFFAHHQFSPKIADVVAAASSDDLPSKLKRLNYPTQLARLIAGWDGAEEILRRRLAEGAVASPTRVKRQSPHRHGHETKERLVESGN